MAVRFGKACAECGRHWIPSGRKGSELKTLCARCSDRAHAARASAIRAARLAAARDTPLAVTAKERHDLATGPCTYCGAPSLQADHIRPISRGGLDIADNLTPACDDCNNDKRAKLLDQWCPSRTAYAASRSPKVAAELLRLHGLSQFRP
ncbi:HNH endonuclease [Salinispora mooreana]|uniref:HNH endonuclease n=1 Tax=Salinispora mooreana TaxID=999545 RepID=UPI0009B75E20|nr:HNH endonuclease [Salinispora mooreana]